MDATRTSKTHWNGHSALILRFDYPLASGRIDYKCNAVLHLAKTCRELAVVKSIWGLVILLFVVLLLFGNRLPAAARALGQSLVEFKRGMKELDDESPTKPSDRER